MVGYWEPHTSSIDFCENNYRFTPYVAELLNSASSLPISLSGVFAWVFTPSPYRSWIRFRLCWLAFITIGLGSCLFHATLRRSAQALDEIPMVLANFVFVFCLARPDAEMSQKLNIALLFVSFVLVVLYVVVEAYAVFFCMYGGVVVYLVLKSAHIVFWNLPAAKSKNARVARRLFILGFGMYGLGFALWIADNVACSKLGFGHLHILWHAFACMGTMVFVLSLIAFTMDQDGLSVSLRAKTLCGIPVMPFLEVNKDDD